MSKASISMPFGRKHLAFTPPRGVSVEVLRSLAYPPVADPPAALRAALAEPLGARPLARLARGARTATVVISDITRPVPNEMILSELLPVIEAAGVPRDGITILIGTGTHRAAPPEEVRTLVGPRIAARYRVVSHDCKKGNVRVGAVTNPLSGKDIALSIDRLYARADLKIVTGLVEPHLFCGYSGGRKAVLPGIAALSTIRRWHGADIVGHPKSAPGIVKGNVAHRLTARAAKVAGIDFCVNVTLDKDRRVTGVFAGGAEKVFAAAVARVEEYVLTTAVEPAKVVVASSAGWPLDGTFYQAIKGLVAALPVMAGDGIVVLVARCEEGLGDAAFTGLVRCTRDVAAWSRNLAEKGSARLGQWQLQRLGWVRQRGYVFLLSELPEEDARAASTIPFPTLQAAVDTAVARTHADRIIVVPEGPYVVTRRKGGRAK